MKKIIFLLNIVKIVDKNWITENFRNNEMNDNKNKVMLKGLEVIEYEHKSEKELQATLNSNAMVEKAFALISEYGAERMVLLQHIGSDIEVKTTNLPELYKILDNICEILDIKIKPKMYLKQDPTINAAALGINKPIIEVNTGTLDKLSNEELFFVIGHEAGHIKSKHVRYGFLQLILPSLSNLIPAIGSLISASVKVLLYRYKRIAEFTADRAGLLCCQNIDTATTSLMKIAGYPIQYYNKINKEDFIKQFNDFVDYNENTYNKALSMLASMNMDHPWSVLRGKELFQWYDNEYLNVLKRDRMKENIKNKEIIYCDNCRKERKSGNFCPYCGKKYEDISI